LQSWYSLAKTEAEEMALEYGRKNGLHVVTLLPGLVVGPLLQTEVINTSIKVFKYIIKGSLRSKSVYIQALKLYSSATLIYQL